MAAQVFLSYSRRDLDQAIAWVGRLQGAGVSVWIDHAGIDAAHLWTQEIFEAIRGCKVVALLASRTSVASEQVVREVTLALQENKRILPLFLEAVEIPPTLQYPLAGLQYLELFRGQPEEQLESILRSLTRLGVTVEEASAGGETAKPGPAKSKEPPQNLPKLHTSFVGRETQLAAWHELLVRPQTRLLTLLGLGGVGKTRAALQLAELCLRGNQFADGIWYIALEEAKAGEEILHQIASVLPLTPQNPAPIAEQVVSYLRAREMLLLLDNTEQIPDATVVIYALLDAPRVKCLVTTRKALGLSIEHLVEVTPLPLTDAEQLFVERARTRKADFALTEQNSADVAALCRRLEGLPLAIELAASRIVGMTPHEIHERLTERFRVLQSRAPDLPARQRALRGTMDWSYELLTPEGQSLFAELAVFAHRFTLAHAEAVSESLDVMEDVEELRLHSLISTETDHTTQQTYFVMLESVREYAAEKLQSTPDSGREAHRRHAEYFRRFAEEQIAKVRTPGEAKALRQFDADHDNVQAALDWCQGEQKDDLCAALALAMAIFHQRRGFQRRALQQIQIGQAAAQRLPGQPPLLRARIARELASLYLDQNAASAARRCAQEALTLFSECADVRGQAEASNLLGLADFNEGQLDAARDHFNAALAQFEQIGDRSRIAMVHNNLGLIELSDENGNKEEAARQFQEVLRLHRESGDQRGIAECSCNLGILAQQDGSLEEAWRYYNEALLSGRALGDEYSVGRELSNLGEVAEMKENLPLAGRLFLAAERLFTSLGAHEAQYTTDLFSRVATQLDYAEPTVAALRASVKGKALEDLVAWALADGETGEESG